MVTEELENTLKSANISIVVAGKTYDITAWQGLNRLQARFAEGKYERAFALCAALVKQPVCEYYAKAYLVELYLAHQQVYEAYRFAAELFEQPVSVSAAANAIAKAFIQVNNSGKALDIISRGLDTFPDDAELWYQKGFVLKALGETESAEQAYRRALALDPAQIKSYRGLAMMNCLGEADVAILEEHNELAGQDFVDAKATLAMYCRKKGDTGKEIENLKAANNYLFASANWQQQLDDNRVEQIKAAYGESLFQREPISSTEVSPIFIVGMPRSGSSLLEQVLSSHSDIIACGETKLFGWMMYQLCENLGAAGPTDNKFISALNDNSLSLIQTEHTRQMKQLYQVGNYYVDKQLDNLFNLGLLALVYPNARFIYTRRNKLDTCLSAYQQVFSGPGFSNSITTQGQRYDNVATLMEHWQSLLGDRIYTVDYEALVSDFDQQAKRLFAFLDIEWQDSALEFYNNAQPVITASSQQVKKPIYSYSVNKWEPYRELLQPLLGS